MHENGFIMGAKAIVFDEKKLEHIYQNTQNMQEILQCENKIEQLEEEQKQIVNEQEKLKKDKKKNQQAMKRNPIIGVFLGSILSFLKVYYNFNFFSLIEFLEEWFTVQNIFLYALLGFAFGSFFSLVTGIIKIPSINKILDSLELQNYFLEKDLQEERKKRFTLIQTDKREERNEMIFFKTESKKKWQELKTYLKNIQEYGKMLDKYIQEYRKNGNLKEITMNDLREKGIKEETFKLYLEQQILKKSRIKK